ncbi:6317_t:CDS:2, partial [Racocetra persica]
MRYNTQHEWFLVEEQPYFIVEPSSLTQKIIAWLKDQPPPQHFDLSINGILYHFNGYWKIRSIKLRNQHPAEYISENLLPDSTMPILKFFLDLYYDNFGIFRNVYHSLGGVYLQIGNMPCQMRKQLRNHFVIGFVPFEGDFKDFIKPFLHEIKKLEQGFVINLNGINYWITGELGMFTADLPQGNDIARTLYHNAYRGCRTCKASKDQLTNLSFDLYYYGPLDSLLYDRHLHTPQDAYHAIAGKAARLLDCTYSILTLYGENNLINYWKNIEIPSQWSRLPNPITYRRSFMMSDNLRILMIFPFILKHDRMPHYSTQSIFKLLIATTRHCQLLSGWCINNCSLSIHCLNEESDQLQIEVEAKGFISTNIEKNGLLKDIMKAYSLYYSSDQALLEARVYFYENVAYKITKDNGDYYNIKLKVGEMVEATLIGESEQTFQAFGKITSIIKHSWNNDQEYVFLCFDWLENLNKLDSLLGCPVYRIQHSDDSLN